MRPDIKDGVCVCAKCIDDPFGESDELLLVSAQNESLIRELGAAKAQIAEDEATIQRFYTALLDARDDRDMWKRNYWALLDSHAELASR